MTLSRSRVVTLSGVLILLFAACETKEHADAELGALKKAKDAAARVSSRAAEPIGVSECDDYIAKYEACLEKVPEENRSALRDALNEQRRKWHDGVAGGQDQSAIGEQCKSAVADANARLAQYGCSF